MPIKFATDEWMKAVRLEINRSPVFRDVARNWRGDYYFVVKAGTGVPDDIYLYLSLRYGECDGAARVTNPREKSPELVLEGLLEAWQRVFQQRADLLQSIMKRELVLTSGPLVKVMNAPKAALELVKCIAKVDTEWSDLS
jgi:putative sterol carrier protein